jgi:hypothetical protein
MKRFFLYAALLAGSSQLIVACKTDKSKADTKSPASPTAVRAQFDVLRDSVRVSWAQLNNLTDHKLTATDQLLAELKASGKVSNPARLATLSERAAALRQLRFDQQTLADNDRLTTYDTTQDSLFSPLARLAAPGGQAPTEKIRDLVEAIQLDDAGEVGQRIRYDRFVKGYNNYLQLHQQTIEGLSGQYAGLQPLPLFELKE